MTHDIFSYIKEEEAKYTTQEQQVGDNWMWSMRDHIQMIFHLKHGRFFTGENNFLRAFKAVMLPLLRLSYWTEDLEVKDTTFFIEGKNDRALSFLIKKYHDEVYVREHNLDTLYDEVTVSDIDYGGAIVQKTNTKRPELLPLTRIAFCDQSDILGGPIAFIHHFSPDKLRQMKASGWGEKKNGATISIEELIKLATEERTPKGSSDAKGNRGTGKTIEVYIVRGALPESYLKDNDNTDDWYNQLQIVAFYTAKDKRKEGVVLYRMREEESNLKFHSSEPIENRALGYSDGEAFLHPQIWTNFLTIHKMNLLEAASKIPLYTDDASYTNRNKIQDMENLEITTIEDGKSINQVPTAAPANIQLMQNSVNEWFEASQLIGAAYDPILGKEPNAGTTFRGQERTVAQGRGWHDRRRGQRAKFIEEIYRDWIIPDMIDEIVGGKEFLASLSVDELGWVAEQLATNYANRRVLENPELVLDGEINNEVIEMYKQTFKEDFAKKGNKHLLKILKGEFKGANLRMGINIANKQKDLVNLSDKLLSIFQFIFANPAGFQQAMQIPALAKSFQDILEFSGMNQIDLLTITQTPLPQMQPQMQQQQPMALNQPVEA